jgi:hypothetical protein
VFLVSHVCVAGWGLIDLWVVDNEENLDRENALASKSKYHSNIEALQQKFS